MIGPDYGRLTIAGGLGVVNRFFADAAYANSTLRLAEYMPPLDCAPGFSLCY
jgi:hypothetical protein